MTEIQLTKEEQSYIRQQIIDRYIDKQVEVLIDNNDIYEDDILESLAERFKALVKQGKYDEEIHRSFKDSVNKDFIIEILHYSQISDLLINKFIQILK